MPFITIVEQPRSTDFVTLARVKQTLGLTDTVNDDRLREIIADVSGAIVAYCERDFARAAVVESIAGRGRRQMMLERTPLLSVSSALLNGVALNASGYSIASRESGFLVRSDAWENGYPYQQWIDREFVNQAPDFNHAIAYIGGYLMPNDEVIPGSGLATVVASDSSFNLDAADPAYFPLLLPGERITVTGFANVANNGTFTVVTRTARKLTVTSSGLSDEGGGLGILISPRVIGNEFLPRDLERIALQEIRWQWLTETGAQNDPTKKSETIGDWSASWDLSMFNKRNSSLTVPTEQALNRWRRMV